MVLAITIIASCISIFFATCAYLTKARKFLIVKVWFWLSLVTMVVSIGVVVYSDRFLFILYVPIMVYAGIIMLRATRFIGEDTPAKAVLLKVKKTGGRGAVAADKYAVFEVTYVNGRVGKEKAKVGSERFEQLWDLLDNF